jgi:hypothetical protein
MTRRGGNGRPPRKGDRSAGPRPGERDEQEGMPPGDGSASNISYRFTNRQTTATLDIARAKIGRRRCPWVERVNLSPARTNDGAR